ncbi:MAG: hypothetical protein AAGH70_11615 [Pseudomonadota bacterium]
MEYDRLSPIKGDSARETTLVTRSSVQQLMAREGAFEGLTQRAQQVPQHLIKKMETPTQAPEKIKTAVVQPPHMRGPVAVTVLAKPKPALAPETQPVAAAPAAPVAESAPVAQAEEPQPQPKSFFGRFFRG